MAAAPVRPAASKVRLRRAVPPWLDVLSRSDSTAPAGDEFELYGDGTNGECFWEAERATGDVAEVDAACVGVGGKGRGVSG